MKYYKSQLLEWLNISWYLISEPFKKVYEQLFEWFAPKWLVYIMFKNRINKADSYYNKDFWIDYLRTRVLGRKRISEKQYTKLVKIINSKSENKKIYSSSNVNFNKIQ